MKFVMYKDRVEMHPENKHDMNVLYTLKYNPVEKVQVVDPELDGNDIIIIQLKKEDLGDLINRVTNPLQLQT